MKDGMRKGPGYPLYLLHRWYIEHDAERKAIDERLTKYSRQGHWTDEPYTVYTTRYFAANSYGQRTRDAIDGAYFRLAGRSHTKTMRRVYEFSEPPIPSDTEVPPALTDSYRYEKLASVRHIRLLSIHPQNEGKDLNVSVQSYPLDEAPKYEALSYVWGNGKYETLQCGSQRLAIRPNLVQALLRLRRNDEQRTLWIDAVCINQNDIEERSVQVQMMRDIYERAHTTIVWLGEANDNTSNVFQVLQEMADMLGPYGPTQDLSAWTNAQKDKAGVWEALGEMLRRPWFYRVWIIQEVSVSRNIEVCCGPHSLPWNSLCSAMTLAGWHFHRYLQVFDGSDVRRLEQQRSIILQNGTQQHVLTPLTFARNSYATRDVDKIYGVLGLSSTDFLVDYTESTVNTYIRFAVQCLRQDVDLDILNMREDLSFRLRKGLPSWAPDWEVRHRPQPLYTLGWSRRWSASHSRRPKVTVKGKEAKFEGFVVDKLSHIGITFREYVPMPGASRKRAPTDAKFMPGTAQFADDVWSSLRLRQWEVIAMKHGFMFEDLDVRHEAFELTLIAGNLVHFPYEDKPNNEQYHLHVQYNSFMRWWLQTSPGQRQDAVSSYEGLERETVGQAAVFTEQHTIAAYGRRLFTTRAKGIMGLCPRRARYGDWLVIFHGGRTPYIIRPTRGGKFVLVGECYAHGLMYGEATESPEADQVRDFVLI